MAGQARFDAREATARAAAARAALEELRQGAALEVRQVPELAALAEKRRAQLAGIEAFSDVYRRYTWEVNGVGDIRLAPFHLLASHNRVHGAERPIVHVRGQSREGAESLEILEGGSSRCSPWRTGCDRRSRPT